MAVLDYSTWTTSRGWPEWRTGGDVSRSCGMLWSYGRVHWSTTIRLEREKLERVCSTEWGTLIIISLSVWSLLNIYCKCSNIICGINDVACATKSWPRGPRGAAGKPNDATGLLRHFENVLPAVADIHSPAGSASEHALGIQEHHHASHPVHRRTYMQMILFDYWPV